MSGIGAAGDAALRLISGRRRRLPVLLQAEAAECGLASLAMIARWHGHRVDLADLRRRMPVSSRGATLDSLVRIAAELKLEPRALSLELDAIDQLQLPCVLHWNMDHFVVLAQVGARKVTIHDPAAGERRMSRAEFGKHFTGVALELRPAADFAPLHWRAPLRWRSLLGRVLGLKRGVLQVLGLALALEVVAVAMPFQLQWVVDQGLLAADRGLIAALGLGFALLVLLQGALAALRGWLIAALSTQLGFQWLANVFGHLLRLPIGWFEKRHLGAIQSYFGSIDHIRRTLTIGFTQAVVDGALVIGTLAMMLLYSPVLSAVALFAAALYAALRVALFAEQRDATAELVVHDGRQHTHLLETVRGIQGVRLFGREQERRMGWVNLLAEQFNAHLRLEKVEVVQHAAQLTLFGLERVVVIWLAALAVVRAEFTLGMVFAFFAYKEQFSTRIAALIDKLVDLKTLRVHLERVADIVHSEAERDDSSGEIDLSQAGTAIELRGVGYRYGPADAEVLCGIELKIAAGECIAITGASGCGKTTLVKLILGLVEPTRGEVLLDGRPLRGVGLRNYRTLVGTVMQDDVLYTGSIADNIAFFDPRPDAEWIEQCARLAAIHDEIQAMPTGYGSLVGDIGSALSGGQKQRIFLARALYRRPRVLVLDEATSHLDVLNERTINATIKAMKLTRIVVAHRPETIEMADRVVVIEGGRVVRDFTAASKRRPRRA